MNTVARIARGVNVVVKPLLGTPSLKDTPFRPMTEVIVTLDPLP